MNTLKDNVEFYSNPSFDAEQTAQSLYSVHDDEIQMHRHITSMGVAQRKIELLLQKRVRENYKMFMHANNEIDTVETQMRNLKKLIETTQRVIQDVRTNRSQGGGATVQFTAREPPASIELQLQGVGSTVYAEKKLPDWFSDSPNDLDRFTVEQRFHEAIALVKKAKIYSSANKELKGVRSIIQQMSKLTEALAVKLKRSVAKIPNTTIWGTQEIFRRLKLLVDLGYKKDAAELFSLTQVDVIRRELRLVKASGDAVSYTSELSKGFFRALNKAVAKYIALFTEAPTVAKVGDEKAQSKGVKT